MSEHHDTGSDLSELGKQLPWDRPDADRREAMRSSLLVAAAEGALPGARRRWALVGGGFLAGALAAAAVAVLVLRPHAADAPAAPQLAYAQIEASSAAELEHTRTPTATGTDELVRVRAGKVRLAVPEVRRGDHVRVQTADAEVEGSGAYEVVVAGDALTAVTVTAGTASVKVHGQESAVFLAAGQTWHAPVISAQIDLPAPGPAVVAPPGPAVVAPPARVVVASKHAQPRIDGDRVQPVETPAATPTVDDPAPTAAPQPAVTALSPPAKPGSLTEKHFQTGWALLRAGKAAEAAIELGAAADAGDDALAADARYFQAVALAKANRSPEAEKALVAFLDHAPTSVRRGRAAVMLARIIAARGDSASARSWFESAAHDSDPGVAAAAQAGLAKLVH